MNDLTSPQSQIEGLQNDLERTLESFQSFGISLVGTNVVTNKLIKLANGFINIPEGSNVEIIGFNFKKQADLNSSIEIAYNGKESSIGCSVFLGEAGLDDMLEKYSQFKQKLSSIRDEIKTIEYSMVQENQTDNVIIEKKKTGLWKKFMSIIS